MAETINWPCHTCGNIGFEDGSDGFFYCTRCGSQADDIIDTGVADEDFVDKGGDARGAIYSSRHRRQRHHPVIKAEPLSQSQPPQSQLWQTLDYHAVPKKEEDLGLDSVGPTGPADFGPSPGLSEEERYDEVRMRYVVGVQLMVQMQCEALVERFGVSKLVCGLVGPIWSRFVGMSRVFDDGWAANVIMDSEIQPGLQDIRGSRNIRSERGKIMIWYRTLRKTIPLSSSLVVSFLACHVAREAVLPTDILKWALEGKLPYLAAFVEIEKRIGHPSSACPLSSSLMFRPTQVVPLQQLESMAASIAHSVGLNLPPVNFYAIASRFLKQLSLPVEKILKPACRLYEWSMPSELWLSENEWRLPTRVCVMSILIVAIRILYNLHGFRTWEMSLSNPRGSEMRGDVKHGSGSPCQNLDDLGTGPMRNSSCVQKSELDAAELLCNLEANYYKFGDTNEYSKDLPTYLQFCKDVVFAGLEPSFENHEEEKIIEQLWDIYQKQEDFEQSEDHEVGCNSGLNQKRPRDEGWVNSLAKEGKKVRDKEHISSQSADDEFSHLKGSPRQSQDSDFSPPSMEEVQNSASSDQALAETLKDEAIRRLKSDMEENRFCYIPPRVNVKRFDYLHHVRKKDEGSLIYVAHADYYILLRACAAVAGVDIRCLHVGVLNLERRLAWTENRIDHCLHLKPPKVSCQFCGDVVTQCATNDSTGGE